MSNAAEGKEGKKYRENLLNNLKDVSLDPKSKKEIRKPVEITDDPIEEQMEQWVAYHNDNASVGSFEQMQGRFGIG